MQNVNKQTLYMAHRSKDVTDLSERVLAQLDAVSAKVAMARHAADSVQISITNGDAGTGCLRSYRVNMTASTSTEISLIFAIDTEVRPFPEIIFYFLTILRLNNLKQILFPGPRWVTGLPSLLHASQTQRPRGPELHGH